jgi:hypothetical protein
MEFNMGIQWRDGYSARVEAHLQLNGNRLRIAQIGPTWLILREGHAIAPGTPARIVIKVDDRQEERDVVLPRGAAMGAREVEYI